MNRRWIVLLILLTGAAWLALFGDKTPSGVVTTAAVATTPSANESRPAPAANTPAQLLMVVPRAQLFTQAQARSTSNPFASRDWTPPAPTRTVVVAAPPTLTPTAPELPFVYVGKKLQDGEWEAYLVRDDKTLIVREGSVLDDAYRVERIAPPVLVLTYLPLQQSQTLNIGSAE